MNVPRSRVIAFGLYASGRGVPYSACGKRHLRMAATHWSNLLTVALISVPLVACSGGGPGPLSPGCAPARDGSEAVTRSLAFAGTPEGATRSRAAFETMSQKFTEATNLSQGE